MWPVPSGDRTIFNLINAIVNYRILLHTDIWARASFEAPHQCRPLEGETLPMRRMPKGKNKSNGCLFYQQIIDSSPLFLFFFYPKKLKTCRRKWWMKWKNKEPPASLQVKAFTTFLGYKKSVLIMFKFQEPVEQPIAGDARLASVNRKSVKRTAGV